MFKKKDPYNIPVYIENVEQFTQIFGEIDKSLTIDEKIEHVKILFEFEEMNTLMNQIIKELKN